MRIASMMTIFCAMVATHSADAAPPKPTGKYALHSISNCQARITTTSSEGNVTSVNPVDSGLFSADIGYITFRPSLAGASSGTAVLSGHMVEGSALRVGASGMAMRQVDNSLSGAYSFTETTFTIKGMVFQMVHANGGRTIHLLRRESAKCLNIITASRVAP